MGRTVIQHQQRVRKRAGPWAWAARRLGALVVTVAGLATATWLSVALMQTPPHTKSLAAGPPQISLPASASPSNLAEINVEVDLAGPPLRARRRSAPQAEGVPLNASAELLSDGYEILSASELASISQARD